MFVQKLSGFTGCWAPYMIRGPRTKIRGRRARDYVHLFFELQEKYFSLELAIIIARNENSIFRENFSSWRFDSGKIFKIILFFSRTTDTILYRPIHLKNLNYLQAKVGRAETRKFPPIPQIGGFRSIWQVNKLFRLENFHEHCERNALHQLLILHASPRWTGANDIAQ